MPSTPPRDDRILAVTRVLAWIIAPILVLAFALLWPVPRDTGRRFAWQITPTLTPMVLASAYLGGAYFFVRSATTRAWHTVKGGFPPVVVFATLLGVATILHWDRFIHSSPAFWLWALLYLTTPFLVAYAFLANRPYGALATDEDVLIPIVVARVVAGVGLLAAVTGLLVFAYPSGAIAVWPWALTPLTARVLGAIFCLGVAGVEALADRRWGSARLLVRVAIAMLALIVASGARAHTELIMDRPLTWAFMIGFPLLLILTVGWYAAMSRRG